MAGARNATATIIDTEVGQLSTAITNYLAVSVTGEPGDTPEKYVLMSLFGRLGEGNASLKPMLVKACLHLGFEYPSLNDYAANTLVTIDPSAGA